MTAATPASNSGSERGSDVSSRRLVSAVAATGSARDGGACSPGGSTTTGAGGDSTGARRPGARARATAESASENAQRNPATLSALECTAASIKRSSLARPEQSDQKVESGANRVEPIVDVAHRSNCRE